MITGRTKQYMGAKYLDLSEVHEQVADFRARVVELKEDIENLDYRFVEDNLGDQITASVNELEQIAKRMLLIEVSIE